MLSLFQVLSNVGESQCEDFSLYHIAVSSFFSRYGGISGGGLRKDRSSLMMIILHFISITLCTFITAIQRSLKENSCQMEMVGCWMGFELNMWQVTACVGSHKLCCVSYQIKVVSYEDYVHLCFCFWLFCLLLVLIESLHAYIFFLFNLFYFQLKLSYSLQVSTVVFELFCMWLMDMFQDLGSHHGA